MGHDQGNETASGAGYERLMARMKSDNRLAIRAPVRFKQDRDIPVDAEGRPQFGRRRTFQA